MDEIQNAGVSAFRREVLEAQHRPALGTIQISTPLAFWVVSLLAAGALIAAILYLSLAHYTRRAQVDGILVPAAGLVTLTAGSTGEVLLVDVRQGDRVTAGQKLVELNNPLQSAAFGDTLARITWELESERSRLKEDLLTQTTLAASQAAALRQSISSLRGGLQQLGEQLRLQRAEALSMKALLTRITPLVKQGYISAYALQQQLASTYNAELQVRVLLRERLSTTQQIYQAKQQLRQIPLTLAVQQSTTHNNLAQIEQSLAENEARRTLVLKAPRAGVIGTLLTMPGQAVTVGEPLLTIVPTGSPLEAQLLVPSSNIGFVQSGQPVVLRYLAFPYEKFGLYFGVVDKVSRSALLPSEISALANITALAGNGASEPMYRVLVRLDTQEVDAYGQQMVLRSGMALHATIKLDRRRLIEWVLEPLYGFKQRMQAESSASQSAFTLQRHAWIEAPP